MQQIKNLYIPCLFTLIITYACIKGFRMPSLWSINYYLPSFFDGFYRRSLPGTILYFLGKWRFNYYVVASIQFSVLIALLIWIYCVFRKNILIMLIISLYFISPAGGYLFHEVGYSDQLLYLVLFISIILLKKHRIYSIFLFSSSIFIHEIAVLTTLPIFFIYLYLSTEDLKKSIFYMLPSIFFSLVIYIFLQEASIDTIQLFKEKIDTFLTICSKVRAKEYLEIYDHAFIGERMKLYYNLNQLWLVCLLFIMSVVAALITYKIHQNRIILALLVLMAGISPLILGVFGTDVYRWIFLSTTSIVVIMTIILLHFRINIKFMLSHKVIFIAYMLCYVALIPGVKLKYFDYYKPRHIKIESLREIKNEFLRVPFM